MSEINFRSTHWHDARYVVEILESTDSMRNRGVKFEDQTANLVFNGETMLQYRYGYVMTAGDRNLDDVCRYERPDVHKLAAITRDLALCLRHLHVNNIVHGNVTSTNAVRVNGHIRLIDFGMAGKMGEAFAGSKFSSGALPPEMFYRLWDSSDVMACLDLYEKEIDEAPKLRERLEPREHITADGQYWYATKSCSKYALSSDLLLPFTPVPLSVAIDMWSLGILLFSLYKGKELLPTDWENNLLSSEYICEIESWNRDDFRLKKLINDVKHRTLKDLLLHLLCVNPNSRYKSMDDVLNHPFVADIASRDDVEFEKLRENVGGVSKIFIDIIEGSVKSPSLLLDSCEKLEVLIPTCIIFSPIHLLPGRNSADSGNKSYLFTKLNRWLDYLTCCIVESVECNPFPLNLDDGPMFLYLVDEKTMEPVIPDDDNAIYPLEVIGSDFIPDMLPLIFSSLCAIHAVNGNDGLARCFGCPVFHLSRETLCKISAISDSLASAYPTALDLDRKKAMRFLNYLFATFDKSSGFCKLNLVGNNDRLYWTAKKITEVDEIPSRDSSVDVDTIPNVTQIFDVDDNVDMLSARCIDGTVANSQSVISSLLSTYSPSARVGPREFSRSNSSENATVEMSKGISNGRKTKKSSKVYPVL